MHCARGIVSSPKIYCLTVKQVLKSRYNVEIGKSMEMVMQY